MLYNQGGGICNLHNLHFFAYFDFPGFCIFLHFFAFFMQPENFWKRSLEEIESWRGKSDFFGPTFFRKNAYFYDQPRIKCHENTLKIC